RTFYGRQLKAVAWDREAAGLMGIHVPRAVATAYALSSVLAGVAGVLLAPLLNVSPTMGTLIGLKAFAVAILGGLGSAAGIVVAGLNGQISLGHAGLYAIGAYAAALGATRLGLGFWTALPLAVVITAAVGAGLALTGLRLSGPYLAMVTIAFGIIVEGALVEWVALTGGPGGIFDIPRPALGG